MTRGSRPEGELEAGELHEKYREAADNPVVKRTVRKYLENLERLDMFRTRKLSGTQVGRGFRDIQDYRLHAGTPCLKLFS